MRATTKLILLACAFAFSFTANADSPITSTGFSAAYDDVEIIKEARESGVITTEMIAFLQNRKIELGQRAALINALGWSTNGEQNSELFQQAMLEKYHMSANEIDFTVFSAGELMCVGYLNAMGNYFDVTEALSLLDMAAEKNHRSYTIQMVRALLRSQQLMDSRGTWCDVYTTCARLRGDESLLIDMRNEADEIIFNYIGLYKDECGETDLQVLEYPRADEAFFEAARTGDLATVKQFVKSGVALEARDEYGNTALLLAADKGKLSVVKFLLKEGADPTITDFDGWNGVMLAANGVGWEAYVSDDIDDISTDDRTAEFQQSVEDLDDVIALLVKNGVDPDATNSEGSTAFIIAAQKGKVELLKALKENGADIHGKDMDGRTALMYSVHFERNEATELLVEMGLDPMAQENGGHSAFIIAAEAGHHDIVDYFFDKGLITDVDQQMYEGSSAMYRAVMNEEYDMAGELVTRGANPNLLNDEGYSPFLVVLAREELSLANVMLKNGADVNGVIGNDVRLTTVFAMAETTMMLKFLFDHGADINLRDGDGATPFIEAAKNGRLHNVEYLKLLGADIHAVNESGRSALDFAANEGHLEVLQYLIDQGLEVNKVDNYQTSPLMHAASGGHADCVEVLLANKAKVKLKDEKDCTALIYAAKEGDIASAASLLGAKAKINAADHDGTTVLMFSLQHPELLEFVLSQKKLDIDAVNHEGQTAAMMAAALNYTDVVETLVEAGADLKIQDAKGRDISSYALTPEMEDLLSSFIGFN